MKTVVNRTNRPRTMAAESEGKIMASASNLCGLCDQHVVMQHCALCHVDMCVNCVKIHQKLPTTRDHKLTDIVVKSINQDGACTKHRDQPLTMLCKDCVELGCDSCTTDHGGHSIETLHTDPKLCHRVVSKNIQHLLDDVHELEEIKSVLEGQLCAYDDALVRVDQWEVDLLKLVKEKADRIRRQLKDLKDEKYKQLYDQVNGLMAKLKAIDQSIAQMTAIRKSMDFTALSTSLSKSQDLIRNLKAFKADMKPVPVPITVDDVLPKGDTIKNVDKDLEFLFTVGNIHINCKGPLPVAEWRFTSANGGKDLSVLGKNHVTMKNVTYGPGPCGEARGAAVVPNDNGSMIVMNPDKKLRFQTEMTFFCQFFIADKGVSGLLFIYDTGVTSPTGSNSYVCIDPYIQSLKIYNGPGFDTPTILTPNSWHKLAVVFQCTTVTVFINGEVVHTHHNTLDFSQTHKGHLHFGHQPGRPGFDGRIASCKFYDVALDANDIRKL